MNLIAELKSVVEAAAFREMLDALGRPDEYQVKDLYTSYPEASATVVTPTGTYRAYFEFPAPEDYGYTLRVTFLGVKEVE